MPAAILGGHQDQGIEEKERVNMSGHSHHHHHHVFDHFQKRLDAYPTGIPSTPLLRKALTILFTEEEAQLACELPGELSNMETIAKDTGRPKDKLEKTLEGMAGRGWVRH